MEMQIRPCNGGWEYCDGQCANCHKFESATIAFDNIKLTETVAVKHGKWLSLTNCSNAGVYCSECHKKVYKNDYSNTMKVKSKYCPNCGAKMDSKYCYPSDMDEECIPMCDFFNDIGLVTQYSCCGHSKENFMIIFNDCVSTEKIYSFLEEISKSHSHTPLIGSFYLWARKVDGVMTSNWIYSVPTIEYAKSDLNTMTKYYENLILQNVKTSLNPINL